MHDNIRTGIGYDAHQLVAGRKLILGGVEIPFTRGLQGWSDADVLVHAVMDALLGAAGLGDIGSHFPPGDRRYKDISSLQLLAEVNNRLNRDGWKIGNLDSTIQCEAPRLKDYLPTMVQNMAGVLNLPAGRINIKAGTSESMGFIGRGEGIAAQAIALIWKSQ
ncbi:MAG TPA: 2-C-methyl-D-erythritol 2,4-cyclodiphosphate synthase [Dehalococcoidales bacterium]|nr:2-C-methyl-D-erythritol 2,4-cyclodiphosphate synthase [Dehalococcoidales bacterium]